MSIGLIPPLNPSAANAGSQLLGVYSATAGASIDCKTRNIGSFTGPLFQSDFNIYDVIIENVLCNTSGAFIRLRASTDGGATFDSGANYDSSGWYWRAAGSGLFGSGPGGTYLSLSASPPGGLNTSASGGGTANFMIYNPLGARYKQISGRFQDYENTANALLTYDFMGGYISTTPMNAFQLFPSAGTFTITLYVYGRAKTASVSVGTGSGSGKVVQVVNFETGAMATGSTIIPYDDTIPQNTEGDQYMSLAITPTNASNKLRIDVVFYASLSIAQFTCCALFQDSNVNAIAAFANYNAATAAGSSIFTHYMTAGTTSPTTFKVRAGGHTGGTVTFNGLSGSRIFGGVMASSITITEIVP